MTNRDGRLGWALGLMALAAFLTAMAMVAFADDGEAAITITTSAASPANESTDVALSPVLSVTVVVNNGPHVTIQWYKKVGSSWVLVSTASNVHNGTHKYNATWVTEELTLYEWRVVYSYVGGSSGFNREFTTENIPLVSEETQTDLTNLVVFGFTLAIIVGVLGVVVARLRR